MVANFRVALKLLAPYWSQRINSDLIVERLLGIVSMVVLRSILCVFMGEC